MLKNFKLLIFLFLLTNKIFSSSCTDAKIGDILQGGYVFQKDSLGCRVVSLENRVAQHKWGCSAVPTDAHYFHDGARNTQLIIQANCANDFPDAALFCRHFLANSLGHKCNLGENCYSGWYLPAADELREMDKNQDKLGNFNQVVYWSSTELNGLDGFYFNFSEHAILSDNKFEPFNVRCARMIN